MLMFGIRVRARRGIILIISLITLLLVTMLVGAVFTLLPTQLAASDHEGNNVLCVAAAASGADYAQSRMQSRPSWTGDYLGTAGNLAGNVVNTPALKIYEDNGNVIGLMTQADGSQTAFRLRFNFQNGASTSPDDGLPVDPAVAHRISIAQVSVNNIAGWGAHDIYTATNVAGNWKVASSTTSDSIPKFESVVYVEGLSGPGLRNATINNLDTLARNRDVVSQVAVVRMGFLSQSRIDSAVYSGGDFISNATFGNTTLTSAPVQDPAQPLNLTAVIPGPPAHLRSIKSVTEQKHRLMATDSGSRVYYSGLAPNANVTVTNETQTAELQQSHQLKIKWSEVPKAPANPTTDIAAGTYRWEPAIVPTDPPRLMYYAQDYPPGGVGLPPLGTGVDKTASLASSALSVNPLKMMTTVTDKLHVAPAGPATGVAFVIDPVYQNTLTIRPSVILGQLDANGVPVDPTKSIILSSTGTIMVQGKIEGVGSITTEGNLTIQGTSLFEAYQDNAVVLYAKKDVSVESIPPTVAAFLAPIPPAAVPGMGMGRAYGFKGKGKPAANPAVQSDGDVTFSGAVFAMGNFTTNLNNGGLYVRGVLSAYGGDPEAVNATDKTVSWAGKVAGTGVINVIADRVEFMYDPTYLMNGAATSDTPSHFDRISWNLIP